MLLSEKKLIREMISVNFSESFQFLKCDYSSHMISCFPRYVPPYQLILVLVLAEVLHFPPAKKLYWISTAHSHKEETGETEGTFWVTAVSDWD